MTGEHMNMNFFLPFATTPPEEKGAVPGNTGYEPVLWKACVKFGLYIAVGADPAVLAIPIPLIPPELANTDELEVLKKAGVSIYTYNFSCYFITSVASGTC